MSERKHKYGFDHQFLFMGELHHIVARDWHVEMAGRSPTYKLVPDARPNADGVWVHEVELDRLT